MSQITVYQCDHAGLYTGETTADESPLEPGVYIRPAGCVDIAPPAEWPAEKWPRWNGAAWDLVVKPKPKLSDPVAKLAAFLAANPDVAELLNSTDGGADV